MPLPNVFIPGVQKAGTSSLYAYLSAHPQCCMSIPKEPTFFSKASALSDVAWYERCFEHGRHDQAVFGEASTSYFADPNVPRRIKDLLGSEVRFVIVLRSPVKRATSAYWHTAKRGDEGRDMRRVFSELPGQLEEAADREAQHVSAAVRAGEIDIQRYADRYDDPEWPFRYIGNSWYSRSLGWFESCFAADRICLITLEELAGSPSETMNRVCEFLGIEGQGTEWATDKRFNVTKIPREGVLPKVVRRVAGRSIVKPIARTRLLAGWLDRLAYRAKPSNDPDLIDALTRLFAKETEWCSERVGRDLRAEGW